jgi:hypothetical protein
MLHTRNVRSSDTETMSLPSVATPRTAPTCPTSVISAWPEFKFHIFIVATETGRKVDEAFIERMRELVRKVGSIARFAEACHLSESAVRKYLAGSNALHGIKVQKHDGDSNQRDNEHKQLTRDSNARLNTAVFVNILISGTPLAK